MELDVTQDLIDMLCKKMMIRKEQSDKYSILLGQITEPWPLSSVPKSVQDVHRARKLGDQFNVDQLAKFSEIDQRITSADNVLRAARHLQKIRLHRSDYLNNENIFSTLGQLNLIESRHRLGRTDRIRKKTLKGVQQPVKSQENLKLQESTSESRRRKQGLHSTSANQRAKIYSTQSVENRYPDIQAKRRGFSMISSEKTKNSKSLGHERDTKGNVNSSSEVVPNESLVQFDELRGQISLSKGMNRLLPVHSELVAGLRDHWREIECPESSAFFSKISRTNVALQDVKSFNHELMDILKTCCNTILSLEHPNPSIRLKKSSNSLNQFASQSITLAEEVVHVLGVKSLEILHAKKVINGLAMSMDFHNFLAMVMYSQESNDSTEMLGGMTVPVKCLWSRSANSIAKMIVEQLNHHFLLLEYKCVVSLTDRYFELLRGLLHDVEGEVPTRSLLCVIKNGYASTVRGDFMLPAFALSV